MPSPDCTKILTEATIDNLNFQVTHNPFEPGTCILWFRDIRTHISFTALGKFSEFDKRKVLEFVVRYSTSSMLRRELEHRRFARKVEMMPPSYVEKIELASTRNREAAYRTLFNLDVAMSIDASELARRRKIMAKRFHPDAGGNTKAMSLINQAYDFLSEKASGD
ncbi:MAG: hypothetical protein A2X49_14750 [Lentisphaerae bacterium GWF2_52_8]|nr:MAG: hypothetical protein A2X49_14750 [Lentisphaerae bacterium GWF2_52_8]